MPCCCGSGCDCDSRQWVITLSGHTDYKPYGDGLKVGYADGECLNAAYVFPFAGGSVLLCETGIYASGFEGIARGTRLARVQRAMRVSTFGCAGSVFVVDVRIGSNSVWYENQAQPSDWGNANSITRFNGSRFSEDRNCSASIDFTSNLFYSTSFREYTVPPLTDLGWASGGTPTVRVQLQ